MKIQAVLYALLFCHTAGWSQLAADTELYRLLLSKDSLLFDAAFNRCDTETMASLFTEDFEFYHDRGGATLGREAFLQPIRRDCESREAGKPQPSKRILVNGSLEVFPLYKEGSLYGAIQRGIHHFEFLNAEGLYQKGDIARFTHVWVKEGSDWKIKRELSFDHQPSDPSPQSSSN